MREQRGGPQRDVAAGGVLGVRAAPVGRPAAAPLGHQAAPDSGLPAGLRRHRASQV